MSGAPEFDEAWIAEQMSHFQPSDMAPAVRIMRGWVRQERDRVRRNQVGDAA
ncbi:hypothetical protein ACQP1O_42820 (plasmid) [Nocardia sp. CA-151230]|uniref:hypothetical protein n=1 Tax=Nocardia sp. CA-151230 TaxID=3239982 RepID=UPI003D8CC126